MNVHQILAALSIVGWSLATATAAPVSVLIEKALYEEKTVGDLEKAISLYEEIIEHAEAHRRHIASAITGSRSATIRKAKRPRHVRFWKRCSPITRTKKNLPAKRVMRWRIWRLKEINRAS